MTPEALKNRRTFVAVFLFLKDLMQSKPLFLVQALPNSASVIVRYRKIMIDWRSANFDGSELVDGPHIIVATMDWNFYLKLNVDGTETGQELVAAIMSSGFHAIPASKIRLVHESKEMWFSVYGLDGGEGFVSLKHLGGVLCVFIGKSTNWGDSYERVFYGGLVLFQSMRILLTMIAKRALVSLTSAAVPF